MSIEQDVALMHEMRALLLALEAIGWLHMAGKAKVDFLKKHGVQPTNYDYDKWDEEGNPIFPWSNLLQWVQNRFPLENNAWPDELTDFIRKHTGSDKGLLGLLQAGHGMASGIEKQSYPEATIKYLNQCCCHMWLSSAFGHPVRNLLLDPPQILTPHGWCDLLQEITKLLHKLQNLGVPNKPHTPNDLDGWWKWREGAVGENGWLRTAFTSTLAETRLPNNDVTLFDQSYVAAALFKSAVAGAVLEGKAFPWDNIGIKQQTRWRLLTVGMGMDLYEDRAVRIGDWTGAAQERDDFFTKVRRLVEIEVPMGSLLYQDASVCVFTFPGERDDSNPKLNFEQWQNWFTQRIDCFATKAGFETPPYCAISEKSSRSLISMTREIQAARKTMAVPLHRAWNIPLQNPENGHVCPVCQARRNNDPNDKQRPCKACQKRRAHRRNSWLEEDSGVNDTIWISEVADENDRVALITMSLDLEPWLDGSRLDSLRAQSIHEWGAKNTTKKQQLPQDYYGLVQLVQNALGKGNQAGQAKSKIRKKIAPGLKDENDNDVPWEKFYRLVVEDRANAPGWDKLDNEARASWLTHQLFRKLASPGRIYRFQRQSLEFFQELLACFRQMDATTSQGRTQRVLLKPKSISAEWKDLEPYNGRYKGKPIDLLYRTEDKGFLSIFNMARILDSGKSEQDLINETIPLKDDNNREVAPLTIVSVEKRLDHLGCYYPVIPLELSPLRFRVLVPLSSASECVDKAVAAWTKQFSRVWDRLPLRVGVLAFPRKTPFQAVVEGVRNMETQLNHTSDANQGEEWTVANTKNENSTCTLEFRPPDERAPVSMTMKTTLPNGREDMFYPYFAMKNSTSSCSFDFKHPRQDPVPPCHGACCE